MGIVELRLCIIDRGLIGLHQCLKLIGRIPLRIVGLLINHPVLDQLCIPLQHELRAGQLRFILGFFSLRLIELGLIGPRINLGN